MTEILAKPVKLDLDLNDLRIIVGCFRLASYLMDADDEPYLDSNGVELKKRLEQLYTKMLGDADPKGKIN